MIPHFKKHEAATSYSVIYSYCPECNECPRNDVYERISDSIYKCSHCGYIGSKETFVNKIIINPKDI
jgi:ribosomal protein L37AE/L43A